MERILKILVIGIFAFLLILWIATVFNTCNNKNNDDNVQTEIMEDSLNTTDDIDLTEDIFDDDTTASANEVSVSGDKTNADQKNDKDEDFTDYTGETEVEKSNNKPKTEKAIKPKQKSTYSGKYLVVAGSYLVRGNAEKMKKRLYDLGYNSEIVNFNLSQYYSVLAGRFNSRKEAQNTVTILKRNGIDSYVHRKKN